MSIDLKHSYVLQVQIKNSVRRICNSIISDIDKHKELCVCKRGFELTGRDGRKYQIILSIKEVE